MPLLQRRRLAPGITRRSLIHDERQNTAGQQTESESGRRTNRQQPDGSAQRRKKHLLALRPKCDSDSQLAEPFTNGLCCHSEDSGDREHRTHEAQDTKSRRSHAWSKQYRIHLGDVWLNINR